MDCCLLSDGNFCNHDDFVGELYSVNVYKEKPKNCPLQSLSDYTKQVRKEVVQEIYKKVIEIIEDEDNIKRRDLMYILDRIQGETK
jgi:hypothetical protein